MDLPSPVRALPAFAQLSARRDRILAAGLLLYLAVSAVYVTYRGIDAIISVWGFPTDFQYFYQGGLGLRQDLRTLYQGNYLYPPLLGAIYAPLTYFSLFTAKKIAMGASVLAAAGLIGLTLYWCRNRLLLLAAALAIVSFWPVVLAIEFGHPTLFFVLAYGAGLIAENRGRPGLSAAAVGIMGLKPSLVAGPFAYLIWLGNRRAILIGVAIVLIAVILPFAIIGWGVLTSYIDLLFRTRQDSLTLRGTINSGAVYMFNWNGFWARLFVRDPTEWLVYLCYFLTIAATIKVWSRRRLLEGWFATSLATALVTPHMLFYDWDIVLPAGIALAVKRPTPAILAPLVLLHLAMNLSVAQMLAGGFAFGGQRYGIYLVTPVAFLVIVYLAFERGEAATRTLTGGLSIRRLLRKAA
jgi:hypothetical protein